MKLAGSSLRGGPQTCLQLMMGPDPNQRKCAAMAKKLTPDRIQKVLDLWELGYDGTIIAKMLEFPSRSAIHGVIFRVRRSGVAVTWRARAKTGVKLPARVSLKEPTIMRKPAIGQYTIIDLTPTTCRFPFGDPRQGMTYCGARVEGAGPYCAEHAKQSYTGARKAPRPSESWTDQQRAVAKAIYLRRLRESAKS